MLNDEAAALIAAPTRTQVAIVAGGIGVAFASASVASTLVQGIILPATDQLLLCIVIGIGFLLLFVALMALLVWGWEASRHNEGLRALAFLVGLLLALAIFVVLSLMFELMQVHLDVTH